MSDGEIILPSTLGNTGPGVDVIQVTTGAGAVNRERVDIGSVGGVTPNLALEAGGNLAAILAAIQALEVTAAAIQALTPALGQALRAASLPVTIASDQTALPISAASLPLPAGAATAAEQAAILTAVQALIQPGGTVEVGNWPGTAPLPSNAAQETGGNLQAIAAALAAALPLPTGAATASAQASILAALNAPLPAGSNQIGTVGLVGSLPPAANAAQEAGGNLAQIAANTNPANTADPSSPEACRLVGAPGGDFDGLDLLEEAMSGRLPLAVIPGTPGPAVSASAQPVTLATDQAQDLYLSCLNQMWPLNVPLFLLDTLAGGPTSYRSFALEVIGAAGITAGAITIAGSNSGQPPAPPPRRPSPSLPRPSASSPGRCPSAGSRSSPAPPSPAAPSRASSAWR